MIFANPRWVGDGRPTLRLRDYREFGPQYEVDLSSLFSQTEAYLAAAIEAANQPAPSLGSLAAKHRLDPRWLERWIDVLDVQPMEGEKSAPPPGRTVPPMEWTLLDQPAPNPQYPAINGWRPKGKELPIVIANASDKTEHIPGRISGGSVAVHPMPNEFVAVVWRSPIRGRVRIVGKVAHAHPSCGNGVAWWVETQSPARSAVISEGVIELGNEALVPETTVSVRQGDHILLAVDARDGNHFCDLTEVTLTISEIADKDGRTWDLAAEIANNIATANPLDDPLGNKGTWRFVTGLSRDRPLHQTDARDENSLLAKWRQAASSRGREEESTAYGAQLQSLLTGTRPPETDVSNRRLYDQLLSFRGPLLSGIEQLSVTRREPKRGLGLPIERFTGHDLILPTDEVFSVQLPAALFRDYRFVVDCRPASDADAAAIQCQVSGSPVSNELSWEPTTPIVANEKGRAKLLDGLASFRQIFPPNVCYPHIIPVDEVVCLKTFHREDKPLMELFLNDQEVAKLERLWAEHRFITKFPIVENEYLPLFIGFVTQDQPQELVKYFEGKRPTFQSRADAFLREFEEAAPVQLKQLIDFASRAYRRPLSEDEVESFDELYRSLREKQVSHEDAFRSLIARVLISPSFLLHLEQSPAGSKPTAVNDWELACRLSYFLWSSMPDDQLRQLADDGRLHDPSVLDQQVRRMLGDDRVRSLAIEFGAQMIHVRDFVSETEKNERLFPEFDAELRSAMREESIRFFQDMFQNDRPATSLIDADHTFLNEQLAKHYGIDGVLGSQWRRVDGVKKHGRGGVITMASVLAKQAGASRTSPVLRGNWIVETLFGERLPQPPPGVPQLPESELDSDLSMREIVARHVSDPGCAQCHQRIDPFGLALENYDAIGRLRLVDGGGSPVDASAVLRDGTRFAGVDGLRDYVTRKRQTQIVRVFYKRLAGYALRRSLSLSDQLLVDDMMKRTDQGQRGLVDAVMTIVQSPQFLNIRGAELEQ
ncbi:MAG: DUF1592 domain-containing protein [Pirellulaceae bacterium]